MLQPTVHAARSTSNIKLDAYVSFAALALAACSDPGSEGTVRHKTLPDGAVISVDENGNPIVGSPPGTSPTSNDGGANGVDPAAPREATCTPAAKRFGTLGMVECTPAGMEGKTSEAAGLVVALHGYTQGVVQQSSPNQAWGFRPTTEWAVLAQKHKFYVIYPDKGAAAFSWYSFFGTTGIGRSDIEPSSIAQMVADMKARHNIDPDKVFVNGLSAGAYMAVVMLATYPEVFAAGATFAGGAYGCTTSCAALGKKGQGWTWPGNHGADLVKKAHPAVWNDANARKPRLMIFQGDADGAVTLENLADLTKQWTGAIGITGAGTPGNVKGHDLTEFVKGGQVMVATVLMKGIGHGTPVDPGPGDDQGGWDPEPSKTMSSDSNPAQDWTNSAGIYGPYYAARFFGLVK